MKKLSYLLFIISLLVIQCQQKETCIIVLSKDASTLEQLAAKEIRRYVYLRTNELLTISPVGSKNQSQIILSINPELTEQEFNLKTSDNGLAISGGSPQAVLYGAYEFAEQIGIRFYMHGDVIPDDKIAFPYQSWTFPKNQCLIKEAFSHFMISRKDPIGGVSRIINP